MHYIFALLTVSIHFIQSPPHCSDQNSHAFAISWPARCPPRVHLRAFTASKTCINGLLQVDFNMNALYRINLTHTLLPLIFSAPSFLCISQRPHHWNLASSPHSNLHLGQESPQNGIYRFLKQTSSFYPQVWGHNVKGFYKICNESAQGDSLNRSESLNLCFPSSPSAWYSSLFWMMFLLYIDMKLQGEKNCPWSWKWKHTDHHHKILPWKKKQFKFLPLFYELEHLCLCLPTAELSLYYFKWGK